MFTRLLYWTRTWITRSCGAISNKVSIAIPYIEYITSGPDVPTGAWEVEQGQSQLIPKSDEPELVALAAEARHSYQEQLTDYQNRLAKYEDKQAISASNDVSGALAVHGGENTDGDGKTTMTAIQPEAPLPPMPPNSLVQYKASIFGLDQARRDCRFEMIKIVREVCPIDDFIRCGAHNAFIQVDAVADDPKLACDPHRAWQYLSPAIFRMLLPVRMLHIDILFRVAERFPRPSKI